MYLAFLAETKHQHLISRINHMNAGELSASAVFPFPTNDQQILHTQSQTSSIDKIWHHTNNSFCWPASLSTC